jgi:hypothetical protein
MGFKKFLEGAVNTSGMEGGGNRSYWNHPMDPRNDDGGADSETTFNDHVVMSTMFYDNAGREVPVQIEVAVDAERQERSTWSPRTRRAAGGSDTFAAWDFNSITPTTVKVGNRTVRWEEFVRAIPDANNEELKRPSTRSPDWQQWLRDVMPK